MKSAKKERAKTVPRGFGIKIGKTQERGKEEKEVQSAIGVGSGKVGQ